MEIETRGMPEIVALLFGVAMIVAFSYERFNRISYDTSRRLERLVNFLTPDKLRARRQVTYAYLIYTSSLVIIYLIFCAYAEVLLPLIGGQALLPDVGATALPDAVSAGGSQATGSGVTQLTTGFAPLGKSAVEVWTEGLQPVDIVTESRPNRSINIDSEVSLGLALVFVGLAPAIKPLVRVDDWLRMYAHRLAGIPTWVIEAADALRANARALRFSSAQTGSEEDWKEEYLVYTSDIERVNDLEKRAQPILGRLVEDFLLDIEVVLVASAWFLDEKLRVPGNGDKIRFEEIETELRRRKTELFRSLEAKKLTREEWELVVADADALAADFCILIALYDEQEIIQPFSEQSPPTKTQRVARNRLKKFVSVLYKNKTEPMMQRRGSNLALLWTVSIVLAWSVSWSLLWPGSAEFNLARNTTESDAYERLTVYTITALNTYCISVVIALTLRWVRMTTIDEDGQRKWQNMRYPTHWTRWLPQALMILFLTWAISTALFVALQMWESGFLSKSINERNFEALLESIRSRFEYNAPIAFRGAMLSLLVVTLLDAREALWRDAGSLVRENPTKGHRLDQMKKKVRIWEKLSWHDSLIWSFVGALIMFLTTLATRYMSFLAAANGRSFDKIDTGLLIWAVLYAVVLTAIVMFCLAEVLTKRTFHQITKENDAFPKRTSGEAQ